jgi:hypothetical protein
MKPNEIRAGFKLAEIQIKTIADELFIKSPAVHAVIDGKRSNPRIREHIAKRVFNKPVSEIWPETSTKEQTA